MPPEVFLLFANLEAGLAAPPLSVGGDEDPEPLDVAEHLSVTGDELLAPPADVDVGEIDAAIAMSEPEAFRFAAALDVAVLVVLESAGCPLPFCCGEPSGISSVIAIEDMSMILAASSRGGGEGIAAAFALRGPLARHYG